MPPHAGGVARLFLGSPLKLWASVGHWAIWHFNPNKYTERQRPRVSGLSQGPESDVSLVLLYFTVSRVGELGWGAVNTASSLHWPFVARSYV